MVDSNADYLTQDTPRWGGGIWALASDRCNGWEGWPVTRTEQVSPWFRRNLSHATLSRECSGSKLRDRACASVSDVARVLRELRGFLAGLSLRLI